jgi:hypothetical protein
MQGLGGQGTAMLASAARVLLRREPRLPEEAETVECKIDGVAIAVSQRGPRSLRLSCPIAPELPADEAALRALMAGFLRYCDDGDAVLCADGAGQLLLIADIESGQNIEEAIADFCNAAVHWAKQAAKTRPVPQFNAPGPVLIFP